MAGTQVAATKTAVPYLRNSALTGFMSRLKSGACINKIIINYRDPPAPMEREGIQFFIYYTEASKSLEKFIGTFASHRQRVSVAATGASAKWVPRVASLHDD